MLITGQVDDYHFATPERQVWRMDSKIDRALNMDIIAFGAAVFDLDWVMARTAGLHSAAWKQLFDDYLAGRAAIPGEPFHPFDAHADMFRYVDGQFRVDAVRRFLGSRAINLPEGQSADAPGQETIFALANLKHTLYCELMEQTGIKAFDSTIPVLQLLRLAGLKTALVSTHACGAVMLDAIGLSAFFDSCVDGAVSDRQQLRSKPHPDAFLAAAELLGVAPAQAIAVEDGPLGIAAAKAAGYGLVIGIDHTGKQSVHLLEHGADRVFDDIGDWATRYETMGHASCNRHTKTAHGR
ncbi:MAG TPA: HAD family hydrolase [Pseudomonas xinjiangensis]|uniref:HAD family hydrolase n=2 Tax=root TaxID=1 RepID=A0A7V1FQ75_9GAMM|nr:HAD family hydrolase [Halopseudomonas xinjiangensis]HEC48300.1 HAD family hydrolase [Halopseudomonas xinjiangensis]